MLQTTKLARTYGRNLASFSQVWLLNSYLLIANVVGLY